MVTRGILSFGADSKLHSAKNLRLSEDFPVIIEMVDTDKKIQKLLPFLDEVEEEGLITQEKVHVIKYRHG